MFVVIGNASPCQDRAQVVLTTQLLACLIQAATQAKAAVLRVDQHIQTVQGITVGVIEDGHPLPDQIFIGVRVAEAVITHLCRQRDAGQFITVKYTDLAFRKFIDQLVNGVFGPGPANIIIDTVHQHFQAGIVLMFQIADDKVHVFDAHDRSSLAEFACSVRQGGNGRKSAWPASGEQELAIAITTGNWAFAPPTG